MMILPLLCTSLKGRLVLQFLEEDEGLFALCNIL